MGAIQVSEIVQLSEAAAQMRAQGRDVIGLGTGEPDFPTPEHVVEAAHQAALAGVTKYPATAGMPALREAVAAKLGTDHGVSASASEVIVCTGAKQVLFNAFMATLDEGDEVVVPAPYWTTYVDMVRICGGEPKVVPCDAKAGFKLTPEALEAAIGPRTRWLLLNTPSNPSGAAYSGQELSGLCKVLERHPDVWLASDEIYEHIVYDGFQFRSARTVAPQLAPRTLLVNGVSKAYAMTGWRIGFGIAPAALIRAMTTVQGQSTSGACSISQAAALAAVTGPQELVAERCQAFQVRRDAVVSALNAIDEIDCPNPDGAFYVFPSCAGAFGKRTPDGKTIDDAVAFCRYLLDAQGVAVVPGRAFGMADHFRISYAYSTEELNAACERIARACAALVPD
jgi:aspartate aminotransferase